MKIKPLHTNTPLIESVAMSFGEARIWLKMEALQPSGSFKNRGVGYACQRYVADGAKRLISSSGGNAGIATAYAGFKLGVEVLVIVPESTSQTAIDAITRFKADLRIHGTGWLEAHTLAQSLVDENSVLIHPFDDPLLWPGHATLIDEVVNAGCIPDAVVLSVGGGGLLCGISQGLDRHGLSEIKIVAVETHGAASFAGAVRAGGPIMLSEISTIANTLGAKQVSEAAYRVSQSHNVSNHLISDQQALDACRRFLDDHRVLVEPACGATLAAIYEPAPDLLEKKDILVVVCGGMGVNLKQLDLWQRQLYPEN